MNYSINYLHKVCANSRKLQFVQNHLIENHKNSNLLTVAEYSSSFNITFLQSQAILDVKSASKSLGITNCLQINIVTNCFILHLTV